MSYIPFTEESLYELYKWVDEIPISRAKRNIARDFADGCSVAEILKFFFPKLVELHNYAPAMSHAKKLDNWRTLNSKVLSKLCFEVPPEELEDIVGAVPGAIERFLRALRVKVAQIKARRDDMHTKGDIQIHEGVSHVDPSLSQIQPRESNRVRAGRDSAGSSTGKNGRLSASARSPRDATSKRSVSGSQETTRHAHARRQLTPPGVGEGTNVVESMREKDYTIQELRETVAILSEKIVKLEELVRVKDEKLMLYREKFGRMQA